MEIVLEARWDISPTTVGAWWRLLPTRMNTPVHRSTKASRVRMQLQQSFETGSRNHKSEAGWRGVCKDIDVHRLELRQ